MIASLYLFYFVISLLPLSSLPRIPADNFLVRSSNDEKMLLVVIWMILNAVADLTVGEPEIEETLHE